MAVATAQDVEDQTLTRAAAARRKARAKALEVGRTFPLARAANLALGLWLQVSAFAWPHTDNSRMSAWAPGLLIAIVALLSMGAPPMRWLNVFLGLVLIGWTFAATDTEPLAYWNGVIGGLLVVGFSVVPSKSAASDFQD